MKIAKSDIFTPANAMTLSGLTLTIVGSASMDTAGGLLLVIIGRLLDVGDGPVARRTRESDFGAFLDAAADKLAILFLLISSLYLQLGPAWYLLFVLIQNLLNAGLGLYAIAIKRPLHTLVVGKRAMFLQITSIVLFAAANLSTTWHSLINTVATITAVLSVGLGVVATVGYLQKVLAGRHAEH